MNTGGSSYPYATPAEWFKSLSPKGRKVLYCLLAGLAVLAALYIYAFTRPGIELEGGFLARRGDGVYRGIIDGDVASVEVLEGANPYRLLVSKGQDTQYDIAIDLAQLPDGEWRQGITVTVNGEEYFKGMVGERSAISPSVTFYDEQGAATYLQDKLYGTLTIGQQRELSDMPSLAALLRVAEGHAQRQRGSVAIALYGLVFLILPFAELFFGGRLFRYNASFMVSDADTAQPSEWYRLMRGIRVYVAPVITVAFLIAALLV